MDSTNITSEEKERYDKVIEKLDAFFQTRKNVIFERAPFNRRNQLDGESAEQYITELYKLAESCDYREMKEELIRDRLVVGIKDRTLSEQLQLESDLTLEKAKKKIRQREAVQAQTRELKGAEATSSVSVVRTGRKQSNAKKNKAAKPRGRQCTRCGNGQHPKEKCPAKDAVCHRCEKKGHYSKQCYTKLVSEVTDENYLDTAFLDAILNATERPWTCTANIQVCGVKLSFKLDTGADITAITETSYRCVSKQKLTPTRSPVCGPSGNRLEVMGWFPGKLSHGSKTVEQQVYVVRGLRTNLLGLSAITALNLAVRVDTTSDIGSSIREDYPSLFQGLGNLGEEYEIKLKPDAKPHNLCTPRFVPLPLREKVRQELDRMESLGVISRVDEPTMWCAGMVVVPKKNESIRICVDLKPLNESVLREVHPLPQVDETLAQLTGAKVFSKLDFNSGFWQIPLAPQSRLLTTFITPHGRYCFNKLPFGISSAPEHFQKRMMKILEGLDGVLCLIDDVLVFGKTNRNTMTD